MLKDVFGAAFWLRNIYLVSFEWCKSKQMLMMRQRIFAQNFVIFWGANAYSGCESVMWQNCELFFLVSKKELLVSIFSQTPVGEFRSNPGKTRSLGAQTKQCRRARLSDA